MLAAAFVMAMTAGADGPLDGRLPARNQVEAAFAASRACRDGDAACPPVAISTRNERCHRIEVPQSVRQFAVTTTAGARCRFQYSRRIDAAHNIVMTRWTGARADFFLVGTPCGGEGQEADLMCYSWMTPREPN
jgi:hypothetical protein